MSPAAHDGAECFDLGEALREAAISMIVGTSLMLLVFLNRPQVIGWRLAAYGAATGFAIYVFCRLLDKFVGAPIRRSEILPSIVVRGSLFFLGGALGWGLTTILFQALSLITFHFSRADLNLAFGVTGAVAVGVGLVFYSFGQMQDRLREGVARLKEAEFAEKELQLARTIQERLLPPAEVEGNAYRLAARNLPAQFVAGDFYDVFPLPGETIGIVVADVSGKGIGASLIMASVKSVVPLVASGRSVSDTLHQLNHRLSGVLGPREFVALCCAMYQPASGVLQFANAGLPDPYLLGADRAIKALSVPGARLPLGVKPDVVYESLTVPLTLGDRILFLTDGLPEARTANGDPLGYEAFARLLVSDPAAPGPWLDSLFLRLRAATSEALDDDWTALLLERCGAPH